MTITPSVRVIGLGGFHPRAVAYSCGPYKLTGARLGYAFGHPARQTPRQIIERVARRHGLTFEEITQPSTRSTARSRQEAMWELRRHTRLSLPQIARQVGVKDHTTVLHGIRAHGKRVVK